MSNKHCISTPNIRLILDSVKYKKSATKQYKKSVNVTAIVDDSYKVLEIKDQEIEIQYKRTVGFQPKAVMNVDVTLSITFALNRNDLKEVDDERILSEMSERAEELLVSAASSASHIISSLTNVSFTHPLITAPFYTRDSS